MRSRSPPTHTHTSFFLSYPVRPVQSMAGLTPWSQTIEGAALSDSQWLEVKMLWVHCAGWFNSSSALDAVFKSTPSFNHSNLAEREKYQPLSQMEAAELGPDSQVTAGA